MFEALKDVWAVREPGASRVLALAAVALLWLAGIVAIAAAALTIPKHFIPGFVAPGSNMFPPAPSMLYSWLLIAGDLGLMVASFLVAVWLWQRMMRWMVGVEPERVDRSGRKTVAAGMVWLVLLVPMMHRNLTAQALKDPPIYWQLEPISHWADRSCDSHDGVRSVRKIPDRASWWRKDAINGSVVCRDQATYDIHWSKRKDYCALRLPWTPRAAKLPKNPEDCN